MTEAKSNDVEETPSKTALYEIMFIINPELGEQNTGEEIAEIKKHITDNGGKVVFEDIWGVQEFAYTIKKFDTGYYVVLNFIMSAEELSKLSHPLNLNKNILRYLITAMPKSYQPTTFSEYKAQAEKEAAEREAEKKRERVKKAVKPIKREEKIEKKEETEVSEKVSEPDVVEAKTEENIEKKKEAAKKAEKEKSDLDDVDEKLKNIINDPDITL